MKNNASAIRFLSVAYVKIVPSEVFGFNQTHKVRATMFVRFRNTRAGLVTSSVEFNFNRKFPGKKKVKVFILMLLRGRSYEAWIAYPADKS